MESLRNKKLTTIALIITLISAAFITFLPTINADNVPTYAFLVVSPNPVGVGQTASIVMWLNSAPPTAAGAAGDRWEGYTVEITKPNGSKETLGPFNSDPVGSQWTQFVPDQLGTYYLKFSYPGQHITGFGGFPVPVPIDNDYLPSTSSIVELTVQEDQIEAYPDWPLPDENTYWDRPIDYENRDWYKIAGNWLQAGYSGSSGSAEVSDSPSRFNPYTTAPNTAHIVWTKPLAFGGIVGGELGDISYYGGETYERKWDPPIIMNGILYYNTANQPKYGYTAVDIRTGETLWWHNSTGELAPAGVNSWSYPQLTLGQLYDYESPNQHGVIPYLWGISTAADGSVTWSMYDAFTGNWILNLANASIGRIMMSEKGDMLVPLLTPVTDTTYTLSMWNSSSIEGMTRDFGPGTGQWFWRPPMGATLDWTTGIEWTVNVNGPPGLAIARINSDIIYASTGNFLTGSGVITDAAFDAQTGQQLWMKERSAKPSWHGGPMAEGVYTSYVREELGWYGYDIYTGELLWGPTEPRENAWGMYVGYGFTLSECIAYGKLYSSAYDGYIYAYDIETGDKLWTFSTGSSGLETVYGVWPFHASTITVADGKLYSETGEHSPTMPLWRGGGLYCVDAETGDQIWKIKGWFTGPAIADGYLVSFNQGDGEIYCFGKGKTAVTVDAPMTAITLGDSVVIRGSITDESPGAAGTPAIADEYMTEWMEYLYMQKPCPDLVEGVEVVLETLDPNNNFYEIGTVTSDVSGMFKLMWEPPVPGEYTIIATFKGSESYWSSYTETAIGVTEAPSPAVPIEPEPTEPTEAPLISTELAIILAAVIVAVAVITGFWIIRKRK